MGLTKVVSFCLGDIPSARIGIVEPMLELQRLGLIEFQFFLAAQLTREILAKADVIICIRSADSYELNIIEECKRAGKLMIYYLDDDLLNIPQYAASTEYFNSDLVKNNIISIIGNCDYLITNNANIKRKYEIYVQKRAFVVNAPALLLKEIIDKSSHYISTETVKIGFSGGVDHKSNLEVFLKRPLSYLKNKYGDKIEFEFMGAKPDFEGQISYKYIAYQADYANYIRQMNNVQWDIAVAPLPQSDFHASKYFNKFLEYGAIGAAGVYSNVEPFIQIIRNQVNGLLVDNTDEAWIEGLSILIDDHLLRSNIRKMARNQLESEFTTQRIAKDIASKLVELTSYQAPFCNPKKLKMNLGINELMLSKIVNIVKSMGFKAPGYILKKAFQKLSKKE